MHLILQFVFISFYTFLSLHNFVLGRISNERKCADPDCNVPVSLATTLLQYHADDERLLSFRRNVQATVLSKEAGDKPQFWEVEINGKRGYVPKTLLRETKVLVKPNEIKLIVPTGRDDTKPNVTKEGMDKMTPSPINTYETPALPMANSKGLFGMMGGVSADSVPPSSPDIKPQATQKYQVFDGTTIYNEPDDDIPEKPPEMVPETKETPSPDEPFLEESAALTESKSEPEVPPNTKPEAHSHHQNTEEISSNVGEPDMKNLEDSPGKPESFIHHETSEEISSNVGEDDLKNIEDSPGDVLQPEINAQPSGILNGFINTVSNFMSPGGEEDIGLEEFDSEEDGDNDNVEDGESVHDEDISHASTEQYKNVNKPSEDTKPQDGTLSLKSASTVPPILTIVKSNLKKRDVTKQNLEEGTIGKETSSGVTDKEDAKYLVNDLLDTIGETTDNHNNKKVESNFNSESGTDFKEENTESIKAETSPNPIANELFIDINTQSLAGTKESEMPLQELETSKLLQDLPPTQIIDAKNLSEKDKENTKIKQIAGSEQDIPSSESQKSPESIENTVSKVDIRKSVAKPVHEEPEIAPDDNVNQAFIKETSEVTEQDLFVESVTKIGVDVGTVIQQEKLNFKHDEQEIIDTSVKEEHKEEASIKLQKESDAIQQQNQEYDEPTQQKYNQEIPIQPPFFHAIPPSLQSTEPPKTEVYDSLPVSSQEDSIINENVAIELSPSPYGVSEPLESENVLEKEKEKSFDGTAESPSLELLVPGQPEDVTESPVIDVIPTESSSEKPIDDEGTSKDSSEESLFSWFTPVLNLFTSSDYTPEVTESEVSTNSEVDEINRYRSTFMKAEESCVAGAVGEEACEAFRQGTPSPDSGYTSLYSTDMLVTLDLLEKIPLETTIWLIVTAVVVLIFSLGHYYIEAHRRDGPLVAIINRLEREVLILKKESSILEDKLCTAQEQLEAWNTSSSENDALIVELKEELEETKAAKAELEEQVAVLEREVETVTESGLEMHRLLSESLSSQDGSQVLLSTVENLREKLELQESEIANLSQIISQKNSEIEVLNEKLEKSTEVASSLEDKVISVVREKEEEALQLKDKHRELMAQLEEVMETKALDETRVSAEMSKLRLTVEVLQKSLADKDSELEEVKEVVKELRSTDSNERMEALFDTVAVRAQLKVAVAERDEFREKFHEEEGARRLLEGHMNKITKEVAELKVSFETAEKEKIEALTKLQVLSNYFKEKESELQKELGLQESMWLQKQSDDHTIYEQMRSLREENEKYKLQNESLKKEIVEQESSFKIQLANVEQKAHENWVASRQAERRLKEVQQEAAQLRNRLTMEKSAASFGLEDSKQNISESNGDPSSPPPSLMFPPTTSPPFMMYPHMPAPGDFIPPPPGDFIPPPPITGSPYHSDSRPPPLGRISSPPLDPRFSPPPPLSYPPYDYPPYGHHSSSPPPPPHRNVHKPQPREMTREQKDSPNYSAESEKPKRRNKR